MAQTLTREPAATEDQPTLHFSRMVITPILATEYLARRGGLQRSLSVRRSAAIAEAIAREEWEADTGETIKFNEREELVDGQHRLTAIQMAGIPITSWVVWGVRDRVVPALDQGAGRSAADVTGMFGLGGQDVAGIARLLLIWEKLGTLTAGAFGRKVTNPEIKNYLEANLDEIKGAAQLAHYVGKNGVPGGPGLWGAMFTRFSRLSDEQADFFAQKVSTGANLEMGDSALALRKRLTEDRPPLNRLQRAAMIVKAWNSYRRDEKDCFRLEWPKKQAFPEPE